MNYVDEYFSEVSNILSLIDRDKVEQIILELLEIKKKKGRVFICGLGGSAANASHMVNDFRKICGIEAIAPTDNIALLTAITNDETFEDIFISYFKTSNWKREDVVFILSVSGGSSKKSQNLVMAACWNKLYSNNKLMGIIGTKFGAVMEYYKTDNLLYIPDVNLDRITPHSEEFQGIIWHLIVNDERLKI